MYTWGIKAASLYCLAVVLYIIARNIYKAIKGKDDLHTLFQVALLVPASIFLFDLWYML
ncbi:hypothetical protein [Clostridium cadaveris]|uniref:hypothetical protein n=1 Tax=Clostridium cadaveris TaxID=1529 RepID=UPI00040E8524|nr:hypothetical protein [Clostridium cadaveris]